VLGIPFHQHPLEHAIGDVVDHGQLQVHQRVGQNAVPPDVVTDRDVVGPASDREALIALVVAVAKKRLRAVPVAHRRVVGNCRRSVCRWIEEYLFDGVSEERRLFLR